MPDEIWVFLQADSNGNIGMLSQVPSLQIADGFGNNEGVPHGSFPHPDTTENDSLRESIEVRMLVFYE